MKITIIPADRKIRRDFDIVSNLDPWPFADSHIHAIQWNGNVGEIEYVGSPKPQNESFSDFAMLQPYLDALDAYLDAQKNDENHDDQPVLQ